MKVPIGGVEYEVDFAWISGGSPTTYSPRYGADGGDDPEIEISKEAEKDGEPIILNDEQLQEAEAWIYANVPYEADDDYYEF